MDLAQFRTEARKRIESALPPKHEIDTIIVEQQFGGFRVGKADFLGFDPVINVPIKKKEDKITYEIETLNPKYTELALKIEKKLSELT